MPFKPLVWKDGSVRFLDQTLLPEIEQEIVTQDETVIAQAICRLAIRGAPLIGIAAAYGVALSARRNSSATPSVFEAAVLSAIGLLESTRPTAANLFWALERQRESLAKTSAFSALHRSEKLLEEALAIHREDEAMCERIASFGSALFTGTSSILTHCNSGALATGGRGTAFGIITRLAETGRLRQLFIDETRPLFQGARLTAWEAAKLGLPSVPIHDSAAAHVMHAKGVDAVIVGADRVAANGDVANKIGTYHLAIAARYHKIPFYVAAPMSTFDRSCASGRDIPIEERSPDEVTRWKGEHIASAGMNAYAPAFDVTPAELITAIITDQGVIHFPNVISVRQLFITADQRSDHRSHIPGGP